MKNYLKRIVLLIGILVFLAAVLAGCSLSDGTGQDHPGGTGQENGNYLNEPDAGAGESDKYKDYPFKLTVLDVGQGLCALIEADGEYMIYDGGSRKHMFYVSSRLKQYGVKQLRYLFASHYDEDHVAGLLGVLKNIPAEQAIIPNYQSDTAVFSSFINALPDGIAEYAQTGRKYDFGSASVEILYASNGMEEKENDRCTVIKIRYGDHSCIITGDAEQATETELINEGKPLDCNVYVAGHHGSGSSSTPEFVAAMEPDIAIISVGADNEYGHPAQRTLRTFMENNIDIYRTDLQGEIRFYSNGSDYGIIAEGNAQKTAGQNGRYYVLNNNTMKFHLPECDVAEDTAQRNKEYADSSRWELISMGYTPCGRCCP